MHNEGRKQKALEILSEIGLEDIKYLGMGNEGVVFHNEKYVYKVLVPYYWGKDKRETLRRLSYFFNLSPCKYIYNIEQIIEHKGYIIEKYPYERSMAVTDLTEPEVIGFLTECWQNRIIIKDCKKKNFIRTDKGLKLVDMDACRYDDNLFLNMCIRMYLYMKYHNSTNYNFVKLQRSAINNFDLPELYGAREFVNRVFANIVFEESKSAVRQFNAKDKPDSEIFSVKTLPNLEDLFFERISENYYISDIEIEDLKLNDNLYFEPQKIQISYQKLQPLPEKVSLLIKTCAQDVLTIEENIKHIVKQLSFPNLFFEVVVSIDTKERDFLREYNTSADLQKVIKIVKSLTDRKIIDRYFLFDESKTEEINKRWFGLPSKHAHTVKNIPVSSQLYAFEQCEGDYILQADSDVLVGRKDYGHSFLRDMISELQKNEKVISVGFNICNKESKEYFGFEKGGFVPEVRLCLFDKKRFFGLRPFPNSLDDEGRLSLSWYRSVEQFQKQTGYCSIRGGDSRSFYIHPQNYRKTDPYAWMTILDRVEQNQIPELQYGGFDCEGSFYDWCAPKRNEKVVVISVFRNVPIDRFLRFWCSLISQSLRDYGIILYDDCSDNGLPFYIDKIVAPYKDRVTLIKGRHREAKIASVYRCIHKFCNNPESIIVMVDGDDALIGKDLLLDIWKKYDIWGIDLSVGRMHQTYRLQPNYRYPVNFIEPRKNNGGNVWQHLKTFRKYLFDSIPLTYFKYENIDRAKLYKNPWFEKCDDYAMMLPMVEMSKSPLQMDFINYFYERDYENKNADRDLKEKCIGGILNKPPLSPSCIFQGRQSFRPDFERIEIDITYDCNLKCNGCNRSCAQSPTKEQMDLTDIEAFIKESILAGKKWKQVNILGGEPTLHRDFFKIIELLQQYSDDYSKETIIQVVSNGITEKSRALCNLVKKQFKNVVIDYGSYKSSNRIDYFSSFNDAPIDNDDFREEDYTKACWVTRYCGIGLSSRGYYACAVCGGIDRVLGGHNGMHSFTELSEEKLKEHFEMFCRFCGNFKAYAQNHGNFVPRCEKEPFRNVVTKTWKKIYSENGQNL